MIGLLGSDYLIDTSSLVELDGLNKTTPGMTPSPPSFSAAEQAKIWNGLRSLISVGRLKLLTQVSHELQDHDPGALSQLRAYRCSEVRVTPALRSRLQGLLAKYPKLVPVPPPPRDPADGWLIAAAMEYGYTIITEEQSSAIRKKRKRKGIPIPDICQAEGIRCWNLRYVANHEGWLP